MVDYLKVDKDYQEIEDLRSGKGIKIQGKKFRAVTGCHSKFLAEEQVKRCEKMGHKVKVICSKSYHVCVPEEIEHELIGTKAKITTAMKHAEKAIGKSVKTVNQASGEILRRNDAGQAAVRKILGWDK